MEILAKDVKHVELNLVPSVPLILYSSMTLLHSIREKIDFRQVLWFSTSVQINLKYFV